MIGQVIGRYRIIELLGEGGMAAVYKAYDSNLDTHVAFKVLKPDILQHQSASQMLIRFENEAKRVANLSHPNIIPILDYGKHNGAPYLVMKYLTGGCLKEQIDSTGGAVPCGKAAALLLPVARALEYAHRSGLVHRDVKPANIMLNDTGEPMLTDFGIAKILAAEQTLDLTGTGVGIGTPSYMAPEQATGEQVDHRADIYSLGVVLYEMVTGRRPFQAATPMGILIKHATEPLPNPRQFVPDLPYAVETSLYKALAKSPVDRYRTMAEFSADLEKIASGAANRLGYPVDRTLHTPVQLEKAASQMNKKWIAGYLAVLLVVLGITGVFGLGAIVMKLVNPTAKRTSITQDNSLTPVMLVQEPQASPWITTTANPTLAHTLTLVPDPAQLATKPVSTKTAKVSDTPSAALVSSGLVAYARGDSQWEIVITDPESKQEWILPNQPEHSGVPSWSPDGLSLSFQTKVQGGWQIFSINLDGSGLHQLTREGENFDCAWSPDGSMLAFVSDRDGNEEVYVMDRDGGNQRRLTRNSGRDGDPSWSPDSKQIVFESKRFDRVDIYRMNTDGEEMGVIRLTAEGNFNSTPAWSPDGRWIAYERQDTWKNYDLWIMDSNGNSKRSLTAGGENFRPAWSGDSQHLAFTSKRGGDYAIWVINIVSGETFQLSKAGGFDAAWSIR